MKLNLNNSDLQQNNGNNKPVVKIQFCSEIHELQFTRL